MDKFAQKKRKERRGIFEAINEDHGLGKLVEKYHETMSPGSEPGEFAKLMDLLRDVDGQVREIHAPLKNIMKAARAAFNRKEYIACVTYLSQYHDGLEEIFAQFGRLGKAVDIKHNEFLFDGLDDGVLDYFKNKLPTKFQPKPTVKAAGLADWWNKLKKGTALKEWEKRFPKFAKKFKGETEKLLTRSESLHQSLSLNLKAMANMRASRKVEDYLDTISSVQNKYREFDKAFESYYNGYVKKFIADQQAYAPEEVAAEVEKANEVVQKEESKAEEKAIENGDVPPFPPKAMPSAPEGPLNFTKSPRPAAFPSEEEEEDEGRLSWPGPQPGVTRKLSPIEEAEQEITSRDFLRGTPPLPLAVDPETRRRPIQPLPLAVEQDPDSAELATLRRPDSERGVETYRRHPATMPSPAYESESFSVPPQTYPGSFGPATSPISSAPRTGPMSFPVDTDRIPGQVAVQEPFGPSPSARPSQKMPFAPSPSVRPRPANDIRPFPANDTSPATRPFGNGPETMPSAKLPKLTSRQFLEELSSYADTNPIILANKIVTFAADVDDAETKAKLLNIASKLLK